MHGLRLAYSGGCMCSVLPNILSFKARKTIGKTMASILTMASAFEYVSPYSTPKNSEKQLDIDIIKEYGLIQQKKSNLTRSQRDWVVYRFNKLYTKI